MEQWNKLVGMVKEFYIAFGQQKFLENEMTVDRMKLREKMFKEEQTEYEVAEKQNDIVEKLDAVSGDVVKFDQVLMLDNKVGSPYLTDATVEGEVLKNGKQRKIKVYKYKNKSRSNRKTQGHRQPYTKIKITKIA